MHNGSMEIADCNNHVKTALEFFGPGCAVNSLSDKYNPLGDNSDRLCDICGSDLPGIRCTSADPYAGYQGAVGCLLDKGEIAFVTHVTAKEYFQSLNAYRPPPYDPNNPNTYTSTEFPFYNNRPQQGTTQSPFGPDNFNNQQGFNSSGFQFGNNRDRGFVTDDQSRFDEPSTAAVRNGRRRIRNYSDFRQFYELLCLDGSRRDTEEWRACNWGRVPSHAIVTSSVKSTRMRLRYQRFLAGIVRQFGSSGTGQRFSNNFNIVESSPRYGNRTNLLIHVRN